MDNTPVGAKSWERRESGIVAPVVGATPDEDRQLTEHEIGILLERLPHPIRHKLIATLARAKTLPLYDRKPGFRPKLVGYLTTRDEILTVNHNPSRPGSKAHDVRVAAAIEWREKVAA